jgi:hypothetical protein
MIIIEIICDTCGRVGILQPRTPAHLLRQELKKYGWTCIEAGGKDYCPECKSAKEKNKNG